MDDTELIQRAQSGDTDAYAALVQRYEELAVRGAYLVTGEAAEAEDAAQQAFIKAYYALDRVRPGASFRPWLLRIVVNEASNLRKAAQRRAQREARAAESRPTESTAPAAEMVALASEQRSALFTALMRLSDEDRLVVGYRYFFDLSEAEMAEALGVARGTVKSRLARALGRLRTTFGEVYPLVILAPDLAASMREGLVDLAAHLPRPPVRDLTNGVLESIRAGEGAGRRPTSSAPASMLGPLGLAALAAALLVIAVLAPWRLASRPSPLTASPAGQKVVAYGGGLTVAERQEVTQLLGTTEGYAEVQTVTGEELVATLQAAGLPVAPGDEAISSAALTCGEAGQGLRVSTRHITRIPAAEYALALLTATPIDASLVIAAPSTKPVTGEAALVGALKVASQCEAERETDPARVRLAYEQLKIVTALAGEVGDWSKASALMLRAAQDVIAGRATDEASIGAALERAAAADGLTISAAQRAEVISLLSQLSNLEYGPYTKGYVIRANSPDEIDVTPARDAR